MISLTFADIFGLTPLHFAGLGLAGVLFASLVVWPARGWFLRRRQQARAAHCEFLLRSLQQNALAKREQILGVLDGGIHSPFAGNPLEVGHLMSTSVETATPSATIEDLATTMARFGVRHLPICKNYGQLVGVVSDRDLRTRNGLVAQDVMTRRPVVVTPLTPISEAIELMLTNGVNCLPVTRGDHLCGLLTTTDVMLAMHCTLDILGRLAEQLRPPAPPEPATVVDEPTGVAFVGEY